MSKQFLKASDVSLKNGGYLSNKEGNPVFNEAFVSAQKHAEYVVTFAKMAKGKNFKDVKADSLDDLKREVAAFLDKDKAVSFVEKPEAIKRPTTDKLAEEAMSFMKYTDELSKVDKINKFMQEFKILKEFEEFGLFFEEDIVKLNTLYSTEDVVKAVTEVIDLL